MDKSKNLFRRAGSFSMAELEKICKEYLSGTGTKTAIWHKYTGSYMENGNINRWLIQLGMSPQYCRHDFRRENNSNFVAPNRKTLPKEETTDSRVPNDPSIEELQKQLAALKAELATEKLRSEGYQLMIEIAEKELKIPIVKKSGIRQ